MVLVGMRDERKKEKEENLTQTLNTSMKQERGKRRIRNDVKKKKPAQWSNKKKGKKGRKIIKNLEKI